MSSEVCECGKDHRDPKDVELAALRAEVKRLSERLAFLNEVGDKDWCGEHPRRFSVNAREGDEGTYDECQKCRAERAEDEVERLRAIAKAFSEMTWERDCIAAEVCPRVGETVLDAVRRIVRGEVEK